MLDDTQVFGDLTDMRLELKTETWRKATEWPSLSSVVSGIYISATQRTGRKVLVTQWESLPQAVNMARDLCIVTDLEIHDSRAPLADV